MARLNMARVVQLHTLVHKEYTTSGKTDAEFARYASQIMGVDINPSSVRQARDTYKIPSRKTQQGLENAAKKAEKGATILERLAAAEAAIEELLAFKRNLEGK